MSSANPIPPHIVIDARESDDFIKLLSACGANVEKKTLDLGDFLCSDKTVVERKTRGDFESSILDRRLFSQLYNLSSAYPHVIVIVEGESSSERINRAALLGAYASVVSDFGAGLFFTRNSEGTAELVHAIAKHEQKDGKSEISFFPKRKTFTISQTQRAVLEQFPMFGPKYAKRLLDHFGNLENVMRASEKELSEVEGIGEKRAKILRRVLESRYKRDEDEMLEL